MTPPTVPFDDDPRLAGYAHPERLVTTAWLAEHLDDEGLAEMVSLLRMRGMAAMLARIKRQVRELAA